MFFAEDGCRVGHADLRLRGLGGLTFAAEEGPFLALAAVGEDAVSRLATIVAGADFQRAALFFAEDRCWVGHADLRIIGLRGLTFAAEEGPFLALTAVGEDAVSRLATIVAGADFRRAALLLAENRCRVGHADLRLSGLTFASEEGPFLALAAVGEDAVPRLATVVAGADFQRAALLLAEDRCRIGHADLRLSGLTFVTEEGPFFALAAVGEDAVPCLATIVAGADFQRAALFFAEDRCWVG